MNNTVASAREALSAKIIARIESDGAIKWIRQWMSAQAPYNAVSKRNYRGINIFHLSLGEFRDPRWMTFNQARQAGYKIKKGSKASHIEMWKPATRVEEDANGEDQEKSGMLCRIYSVFNAEQIEGIPPLSEEPPREVHANDLAEKIASNCGCAIHHGGAEAFYSPANDTINIPRQRDFFSDSAYYHTLMHEISHSTGHKSRLNRDMSCNRGSESYALEELRAELGGAFVCKDIGLITDEQAMDFHIEQHAAYIKVWLQVLKNDKKKLLSAISDANKIANYVAEYRDGQKEAQVA